MDVEKEIEELEILKKKYYRLNKLYQEVKEIKKKRERFQTKKDLSFFAFLLSSILLYFFIGIKYDTFSLASEHRILFLNLLLLFPFSIMAYFLKRKTKFDWKLVKKDLDLIRQSFVLLRKIEEKEQKIEKMNEQKEKNSIENI